MGQSPKNIVVNTENICLANFEVQLVQLIFGCWGTIKNPCGKRWENWTPLRKVFLLANGYESLLSMLANVPVFIGILQDGALNIFAVTFSRYPFVNSQFDPENHQFLAVSLIFQPLSARVELFIYWRLHHPPKKVVPGFQRLPLVRWWSSWESREPNATPKWCDEVCPLTIGAIEMRWHWGWSVWGDPERRVCSSTQCIDLNTYDNTQHVYVFLCGCESVGIFTLFKFNRGRIWLGPRYVDVCRHWGIQSGMNPLCWKTWRKVSWWHS